LPKKTFKPNHVEVRLRKSRINSRWPKKTNGSWKKDDLDKFDASRFFVPITRTQRTNDAEKGNRFQKEVRDFVEKAISKRLTVAVPCQRLSGSSARWNVDIVVRKRFTKNNTCLAVISCKHVKEGANPATYWTEMSRTYMELNDLKLNSDLDTAKFYVVVNRHCMKGEVDKNYPILFRNIGVSMINFHEDKDRRRFADELRKL
jgi:hypothetical protein